MKQRVYVGGRRQKVYVPSKDVRRLDEEVAFYAMLDEGQSCHEMAREFTRGFRKQVLPGTVNFYVNRDPAVRAWYDLSRQRRRQRRFLDELLMWEEQRPVLDGLKARLFKQAAQHGPALPDAIAFKMQHPTSHSFQTIYAVLQGHHEGKSRAVIARLNRLQHCSVTSILRLAGYRMKDYRLAQGNKPFEREDRELLRKLVPDVGYHETARRMLRPYDFVRDMALQMGVRSPRAHNA